MEAELDGEQRRLGDASKNLRKAERRIKELDFQAKIYIPNAIRTQKNNTLLFFWGRHGSTEIFCNFGKISYLLLKMVISCFCNQNKCKSVKVHKKSLW